ncbi:Hypothetical protein UVM_LOCUS179, partial [uncultured virus]
VEENGSDTDVPSDSDHNDPSAASAHLAWLPMIVEAIKANGGCCIKPKIERWLQLQQGSRRRSVQRCGVVRLRQIVSSYLSRYGFRKGATVRIGSRGYSQWSLPPSRVLKPLLAQARVRDHAAREQALEKDRLAASV